MYVVGGGPNTYVVSFPRTLQSVECPVQGIKARAHNAGGMRDSFRYRYFLSKVAVLQDGRETLPRWDM